MRHLGADCRRQAVDHGAAPARRHAIARPEFAVKEGRWRVVRNDIAQAGSEAFDPTGERRGQVREVVEQAVIAPEGDPGRGLVIGDGDLAERKVRAEAIVSVDRAVQRCQDARQIVLGAGKTAVSLDLLHDQQCIVGGNHGGRGRPGCSNQAQHLGFQRRRRAGFHDAAPSLVRHGAHQRGEVAARKMGEFDVFDAEQAGSMVCNLVHRRSVAERALDAGGDAVIKAVTAA